MDLHKSLTLGIAKQACLCSRLIAIFKKYILCGLFAAGLTAFTGCDDLFRDPGFAKGGVSIHYLEHWLEERKAQLQAEKQAGK